MKSDIDALMAEHEIAALLVTGPGTHNPAMTYLTGGALITQADLIKKAGRPAVLYHGAMERDEAAKAGLPTHCYTEIPMRNLMREAGGDALKAGALRYQYMLKECGVEAGKVLVYGRVEAGRFYTLLSTLQKALPDIEFQGDMNELILPQAMATKDPGEVERIRRMGALTVEVTGLIADYITSHAVKNEILVKPDGLPLTVGDVKNRINLWLAERSVENPEGTIFSIGRDAAVPHSTGTLTDPLRLGQTIILDFFPREPGGGYFYDFTRTWSLGYATDEALRLYEQVRSVYTTLRGELKLGESCAGYQLRACELFTRQGHPTIQATPETTDGYVHSLGHGVGLNIHERPWFHAARGATADVIQPGAVFTCEPGLYYPDRGLGVRLEDTLYAAADGTISPLADYPYDLILPVKK
jgi:Xaa-Pro aminopeptidase